MAHVAVFLHFLYNAALDI